MLRKHKSCQAPNYRGFFFSRKSQLKLQLLAPKFYHKILGYVTNYCCDLQSDPKPQQLLQSHAATNNCCGCGSWHDSCLPPTFIANYNCQLLLPTFFGNSSCQQFEQPLGLRQWKA